MAGAQFAPERHSAAAAALSGTSAIGFRRNPSKLVEAVSCRFVALSVYVALAIRVASVSLRQAFVVRASLMRRGRAVLCHGSGYSRANRTKAAGCRFYGARISARASDATHHLGPCTAPSR